MELPLLTFLLPNEIHSLIVVLISHATNDILPFLVAMAHFTREGRESIDENPLGDSLSGVREALREAEHNTY